MTDVVRVLLGDPAGDRIELRVHSRAHPGGLRVYDHNWLNVEAVAKTAARSWRFLMYLRAEDFVTFADRLAAFAAGSSDEVEFESVDGWLDVTVQRGKETCALEAYAREGHTEKAARLRTDLDPVAVTQLTDQVRAVADAYPVIP